MSSHILSDIPFTKSLFLMLKFFFYVKNKKKLDPAIWLYNISIKYAAKTPLVIWLLLIKGLYAL